MSFAEMAKKKKTQKTPKPNLPGNCPVVADEATG